MIGELFINNKDAWQQWSVRLVENSYENLLIPAPPKAYMENKFRSQDGKQVLIANPRIDERSVQVTFAITCDSKEEYLTKYDALLVELNKGLVELKVPALKTTYKLIVENYMSLSASVGLRTGKLSVKFNEPNPKDRIQL